MVFADWKVYKRYPYTGKEVEGIKMIGAVIRGEEEAKRWYNGSMSSKEAAKFLGVSPHKLRKMVKEDKIPYSKSYNKIWFHEVILNAWSRGEFTPGRVELILDEESIDFDHKEALREHYERYPDLLEKTKEKEGLSFTNVSDGYKFEVKKEGVLLSISTPDKAVAFQVFLNNTVIDNLIRSVQEYRSKIK